MNKSNVDTSSSSSDSDSDTPTETADPVEQPFSTPNDITDVTFIVENKEMHFYRAFLSVCSPVFKAMLKGNYMEKEAKTIPLPKKKHEDMVVFFKQLHPMYCKATPITADNFEKILPLADEYQAQSVLDACEVYIGHNLSRKPRYPAIVVRWLLLCDRHRLKKHRKQLIARCAQLDSSTLEDDENYKELPQELAWVILLERCKMMEQYVKEKVTPLCKNLERFKDGFLCKCNKDPVTSGQLCAKCFPSKISKFIKCLEPFP